METADKHKENVVTCRQRLDFYWHSISAYAIVLIVYSLLRGSIEESTITMKINDPIFILLLVFILISTIGIAINSYKRREIVIGRDFIEFKGRFGKKIFKVTDIEKISFGRVYPSRVKNSYRMIKIRVKGRRRIIRIRPSAFTNEEQLRGAIAKLRKPYQAPEKTGK